MRRARCKGAAACGARARRRGDPCSVPRKAENMARAMPSRRRQVNIFWRKAEALTWTLLAFNMAYRGALQQHVDEDIDGEAAMRLQECGGVIGAMT